MKTFTWREKIQYTVDNIFSRGTMALILWLGVLSLVIILLSAALITLLGVKIADVQALSFGEAVWASLMRTLDAGTMGGDEGWAFRIIMFVLPTLGGVFIISTLIGVLSTGLGEKMDELRKGRSRVIEHNHTVILGWSEQIFTILSELMIANENQKNAAIVILGGEDKVSMEDAVRNKVLRRGSTRVICRSGSPIEMDDLALASLDEARSIIVLSPDKSSDPDAEVIKTILAIVNQPGRRAEPYRIVAELRNPRNYEVARVVGRGEVQWIRVGSFVARIIAQTCRQSGLSTVYNELLDFSGDEIYFTPAGDLAGKLFGESLGCFESNTVLGLRNPNGVKLNPPMDTRIGPKDSLIVIAADDDRIFETQAGAVDESAIALSNGRAVAPERTLILGWNWRAPSIIQELDAYVAPGSEVRVVADLPLDALQEKCCLELSHQTLQFQRGETTDRATLEALGIASYHHIILLCYSDTLDAQEADSLTLITLLHLRDMGELSGQHISIVSEMLDIRNRNLAEVTRADDFIVSDKLISLMLAQVSENPDLNAVFEDLFDPEGAEIYLKPVEDYVRPGAAINFYTLVEAARRKGELAIGYRLQVQAQDAGESYGVHLNPRKSEVVKFRAGDRLIVLADQ